MDVCTTQEAARFLGTSTTRVRQYLHDGKLVHGGYQKNPRGRVVAMVEMESLKRLKERRALVPQVAAARWHRW